MFGKAIYTVYSYKFRQIIIMFIISGFALNFKFINIYYLNNYTKIKSKCDTMPYI